MPEAAEPQVPPFRKPKEADTEQQKESVNKTSLVLSKPPTGRKMQKQKAVDALATDALMATSEPPRNESTKLVGHVTLDMENISSPLVGAKLERRSSVDKEDYEENEFVDAVGCTDEDVEKAKATEHIQYIMMCNDVINL